MKAVLFVLIGWANRYDGTELIRGGHRHLKDNPERNGEMKAFVPDEDGYYRCGIGDGEVHESDLDIVFVARSYESNNYQIVGIYNNANIEGKGIWKTAISRTVLFFSEGKRHQVGWPFGRGMRRWAKRLQNRGPTHKALLSRYNSIATKKGILRSVVFQEDLDVSAFEGMGRKQFVIHRTREAKLRAAKILSTIKEKGSLKCEVPGCGFDFHKTYGEIGCKFAVVHHLIPLSEVSLLGRRTSLSDLAVVCANCHAMIHRGGECRELVDLIAKK